VSKTSDLIKIYLAKTGPAMSSAVAKHLERQDFTRAAARKAIQRAKGVHKLSKIRFKHKEQFLYLPDQYRTERFFENLLIAFDEKESAYGIAINSLIGHHGLVPKAYFDIISGSPVLMKKQLSSGRVLERLSEIGIFKIDDHGDAENSVSLLPATPGLADALKPSASRSRLLAEDILLVAVREWMRNLGLGSYNRVEIRSLGAQPQFGQFKWDVTAPSYVHPLVRYNKTKANPGFIVADVLLGQDIAAQHLHYFLKKNILMRSQRTTAPFLSFFIAEHFTKEAFDEGRKAGVILATTETLFGREVASGLAELIQVLNNAAQAVKGEPAQLEKLFSKLDAMKGAELNVRGALFELLFARCLSSEAWDIVFMNRLIKDPGTGSFAEIDILAKRGKDVLVCECKGYSRNVVTEEEVKLWMNTRIPRVRGFLQQEQMFRDCHITFEFCTTSGFTPEALKLLQRNPPRKYNLRWKDREDLHTYISGLKDSHLLKLLNDYYPPVVTT
jgi:hypothetical protein